MSFAYGLHLRGCSRFCDTLLLQLPVVLPPLLRELSSEPVAPPPLLERSQARRV